jgi:hypothetical protein
LAWFLRGAHRRKCKNHAKRVIRNKGNGMRDNVAIVQLNDLEKLLQQFFTLQALRAEPVEWGSVKAVGFEARGDTSPLEKRKLGNRNE